MSAASRVPEALSLPMAALDRLMPMNAVVGPTGHILHAGPTLAKLCDDPPAAGARFLELFELRRPRAPDLISDLHRPGGMRLSLRPRARPELRLRGVALPVPQGGMLLVNLSLGISAVDAVGALGLNSSDFSATDLTPELLYLVEAKNAVMEESRDLNMRLQGAKSAAEEAAFTDTLTGLKNRRAMDMILARYKSCRESFSLMHLDLDHFKAVNDTLGHAAGDHVLQEVARILTQETRGEDSVVRVGGDEFVLLFHRQTDPVALSRIAERILNRLNRPIDFEGNPCRISGSIGITMSSDYAVIDPEQMMLDADVALYASKAAGRACYKFIREIGGVGQNPSALAQAAAQPRTAAE